MDRYVNQSIHPSPMSQSIHPFMSDLRAQGIDINVVVLDLDWAACVQGAWNEHVVGAVLHNDMGQCRLMLALLGVEDLMLALLDMDFEHAVRPH